jgi:GT2 family glycosyltransferase
MTDEDPRQGTDSPTATIIVNWNGCATTVACVQALLDAGEPQTTIFVVDNGSTDDSVVTLRSRFPRITVLEARDNLGFARGSNLGVQHVLSKIPARGAHTAFPYLFLLNNDAFVNADTLPRLVAALEQTPGAAVAVPKIYYGDGRRLWYGGGHVDWKAGTGIHRAKGELDRGQADQAGRVTFAPGCALLLRREVVAADGPFDARYFFMGEDVELSLRLTRAGRPIVYVPSATVRHQVGTSAGRQGLPFIWYHMTRNRLLTVSKHATIGQKALFFTCWPPRWLFKVLIFIARGEGNVGRAMWQGVQDFRAGRFT